MSNDSRTAQVLVQKMLREISDIEILMHTVDEEQFYHDMRTQKAVTMSLINLGEFAKRMRDSEAEFVQSHPEIPINAMAGFRDRAAHNYEALDMDIVLDTVQNDIPLLKSRLLKA